MAVRRQTLANNTYDTLKDLILSGHFVPGQRLKIEAVSQELGVSITPLREAFFKLEREGILEIREQKGTFVRTLNKETILESYEIREMLEGLAARLAAIRATPEDIKRLKQINREFKEALSGKHVAETFEANILFHQTIAVISGNKKLAETINNFFFINMFSNTGATKTFTENGIQAHEGHKNIIKAIESRDPAAAESIVRRQIRKGVDQMLLAHSEWEG